MAYIVVALICVGIFAKAFYIQQVQGNYWRGMSDSLHLKIQEVDADRGTIYSEDGEMLSTSIPQFDIYVDFDADGLRVNDGKLFRESLDSLSYCLAAFFKDRSKGEYKRILSSGGAISVVTTAMNRTTPKSESPMTPRLRPICATTMR